MCHVPRFVKLASYPPPPYVCRAVVAAAEPLLVCTTKNKRHKGNTNARGGVARGRENEGTGTEDAWKPGGLRRFDTGASRAAAAAAAVAEEDLYSSVASVASLSPAPWSTMASVMLGTWEKRPQTTNPKDRDTLFDNSAAFVRACFPTQVVLLY